MIRVIKVDAYYHTPLQEDTKKPQGVLEEVIDYKFQCPVCGLENKYINRPDTFVDLNGDWHLRRCPRCKSVLRGLGRVWWIVERKEDYKMAVNKQTHLDQW